MARVEGIVFTLFTLTEPAQPSILPERMEPLPTPSQQLVCVGLIARVPHNLILGGVEQRVQGHGEFYHSKVRGQMPPDVGHHTDNLFSKLLAQDRELRW